MDGVCDNKFWAKKCCLTFRLFTTFQPAYKALRSNAAGWNVGEGGVGA
jgi:hypothetical protein